MLNKLEVLEDKYKELSEKIADPEIINDQKVWQKLIKEHADLEPIVMKFREYKDVMNTIAESKSILHEESDEESTNHRDTLRHEHYAFMDGIKPLEPISTHPRLCLLVGTIHEPKYDPWRKVKMGIACVLEHSGRRYGKLEGYKRIGLVSLPFDEYWSEVKDSRTIELV